MDILNNINIITELFLSLCYINIFISLFKLYYGSKVNSKNNIVKKSSITVISFFIVFFLLFCFVNFYIKSNTFMFL
ncbi:hypothetical protein CER18_07405 [Bartonella tribocorum]|uniref:Uncharacterized protein n=1 Tax=Bartonella tribocorum TaxID=85701 RepID=A0A2N9Y9A9_9HYPH|nr:hypothetical protein CER18_07405 [Bartonella tribocorum]